MPASAGAAPGPGGVPRHGDEHRRPHGRVGARDRCARRAVRRRPAAARAALVARRVRGSAARPARRRSTSTSTPAYAIRGHQLGYRQHSNTYDAWDEARYDRYIRDLALFGANSIENIPLQDTRVSPHFPVPRDEMNVAISRVCARYDLDYWIWTPADFDLADAAQAGRRRSTRSRRCSRRCRGSTRSSCLAAILATTRRQLVLPYLEDLADARAEAPPARQGVAVAAVVRRSRRSTGSTSRSTRAAAALARRPGGRTEQPAARRDARPPASALSAARLSGRHAHGARPVRRARLGSGLQLHARPRADQPAAGLLRRRCTIASRRTPTASSATRMA